MNIWSVHYRKPSCSGAAERRKVLAGAFVHQCEHIRPIYAHVGQHVLGKIYPLDCSHKTLFAVVFFTFCAESRSSVAGVWLLTAGRIGKSSGVTSETESRRVVES